MLDAALLLIEPTAAAAYAATLAAAPGAGAAPPAAPGAAGDAAPPSATRVRDAGDASRAAPAAGGRPARRFYATKSLDPLRAKLDFSTFVDEVVQHFTTRTDVQVEIIVEVRATSAHGFSAEVQRTVRENCRQLGCQNHAFEEE